MINYIIIYVIVTTFMSFNFFYIKIKYDPKPVKHSKLILFIGTFLGPILVPIRLISVVTQFLLKP